ncbi:oxidoreductase, zinc-binding dehydrogenase family protein [Calothrix sp. NIES-4071]|nr:oxidoreductase, zinc-binding dehydrogenase family protein [Calothrix sp. NIES-4071]BAZ63939.1 oxidoreductase, zinc-binding dehydrogenase family protein [Calothrix sp. NIES-4105]
MDTTTIKTMQAAWYEELGSAQDVIRYGQIEIPTVGANEVLVRVHASGVNPSDTKRRGGWGGGKMEYSRVIPHNDGAGIIEQVGEGVSPNRIGERVWIYEAQQGRPYGTAAEYVVVPSNQAILLPANTSFAEGACLGVPAMTAHRTVFADGDVEGQIILVTGGAGAVGNYAVQWAKWGGATVITTISRPEQAEIAKKAGADYIINYKTEDVVQRIQEITGQERGINRIVDVSFNTNVDLADAVVCNNGAIAFYAGNASDRASIPLISFMLRNITIHAILVYTMPEVAKQTAARDINTALSGGALKHNIAKTFTLSQVAEAHEAQDSGKMIGKAIIEIN